MGGVPGRADTPQDEENAARLKRYWTKDPEGLAKWAAAEHPWYTLRAHLMKFMDPDEATRTTTRWFFAVFHRYPTQGEIKGPGGKFHAP